MQPPTLAVIDYGSGNLRSVGKALTKVGARVELVSEPVAIESADALVLPGVGSFGDCAAQLRQRDLWSPIAQWLESGKPFLGICLGYQLLFESSEESPGVAGFGRLKGRVKRFDSAGLKVPQIGWNRLRFCEPSASMWAGLENGAYVYFVHSFYPQPDDQSTVTATADYGGPFAAAIAEGAVSGMQFHPEKSQTAGLTILRNFVASAARREL